MTTHDAHHMHDPGEATAAPAAPVLPRPPVTPVRAPWHAQTSARYWVCLGLLVSAALGLHQAGRALGLYFRKEAVPIKKPLAAFDFQRLGPQYQLDRLRTDQVPAVSDEQRDSLGTDEYLNVYLTDTTKLTVDPTRLALLFVTYYTGKPDMVPHVPDECWLASGYDPIGEATVHVRVRGIGAPNDEIPVRVLEFRARQRGPLAGGTGDTATVLYFFHANGHFTTTRHGVRTSMSNPFQRYGYYSKIEITFGSEVVPRANKAVSVAALGPLLERVLPVLLQDHYDLDKFAADSRTTAAP